MLQQIKKKKIKKQKYKKNKDTLSKNFEKKYTKCHQCNKVGKKFDTKKWEVLTFIGAAEALINKTNTGAKKQNTFRTTCITL